MNEFNLNIMHLNVKSLCANFDHFKNFVFSDSWSVVAVGETWLKPNIDSALVNLDGYRFIRRDRVKRGGGVGLYLSEKLKYKVIKLSDKIEQLWVSVSLPKTKIIIGVVYRPPDFSSTEFLDELDGSISYVSSLCDNIICLGDVNIDLLKSNLMFENFLNDLQLNQLIDEPTRITSSTATLIDILLTNNKSIIKSSGVLDYHYSDHDAIFCRLGSCRREPEIIIFRNLRGIDLERLHVLLAGEDLNKIFHIKNIDEKVNFLTHAVLSVFDLLAPIKTIKKSKPSAPWLTDTLKILMKLRDNAKSRYRRTNAPAHFIYYKQLRNLTNSAVKREKKIYFSNIRGDPRHFWKGLRNMGIVNTKPKPKIPAHLNDPDEMNKFFIQSVPAGNCCNQDLVEFFSTNIDSSNSSESFNFKLVESSDISEAIDKIKTNAVGLDGLNLEMIKMCLPVIRDHILNIINSCLLENCFPTSWKIAQVTPIAKSQTVNDYCDLRPISILPTLSKILEHIMNNQIRAYLDVNSLFPSFQYGFRKGYGCVTALLNVTDDIIRATDDDLLTVLVLLDYSKAFDCINHVLLNSICHYFGFSNGACSLIESYLTGRGQAVRVGNALSRSVLNLTRGVPQGSILGPLLFCLYTAMFDKYVQSSKLIAYADDTQLSLSFGIGKMNESIERMNRDLQSVFEISKCYDLALNPTKTKVLLFGPKRLRENCLDSIELKINGVPLEVVQETRNLGLVMDGALRFKSHVSKIIGGAVGGLKIMYQHRSYLSKSMKSELCKSVVLSHLNYCLPVFGPCLDALDLYRLQKVQNSCIRFVFGIRKFDRVSTRLHELGWLNVKNNLILRLASIIHRVLVESRPPCLRNRILLTSQRHNINVRSRSYCITAPRHRTALYERSFTYNSYRIYSRIPERIKLLRNTTFKKNVYLWLLNTQQQGN